MSELIFINLPYGVRIWMRVNVDDPADYLAKLSQLNLKPVWQEAANIMRRSFAQTFRQGGRPRWDPLKPGSITGKSSNPRAVYASMRGRARVSRLAQVRAQGGGLRRSLANILIVSGEYRDSWAQKSRDHYEKVTEDGMESGSQHRLAPIHEFGTGIYGSKGQPFEIKPRNGKALRFMGANGPVFARKVMNPGVPSRPVGIIHEEDEARILDLIERAILDAR